MSVHFKEKRISPHFVRAPSYHAADSDQIDPPCWLLPVLEGVDRAECPPRAPTFSAHVMLLLGAWLS